MPLQTVDVQLSQLANITSRMSEDLLQTVYVFGEILDRLTSEICDQQIVQVSYRIIYRTNGYNTC